MLLHGSTIDVIDVIFSQHPYHRAPINHHRDPK
jgi:hypothetical protein